MANFNYLLNNCGGTSQWTTSGSNIYYNTGNIGIGTASPTHTLDISGSLNVSGTITCGSGCSGSGSSQWGSNGSNIYYSSGSVGIGTTTPSQALAVVGNIYATGNITCGGTCGSGGGGSSQWTTSGSNISYTTGNIGIGTTNPLAPLHIKGPVTGGLHEVLRLEAGSDPASPASGPAISFRVKNDNYPNWLMSQIGSVQHDGAWGGDLVFYTANDNSASPTEKVRIDTAGNVGIGTASPSYTLHVNGTAYATGAAGALSDIRDKRDIAPLSTAALDAISKLRPVTFLWKTPKDDGMKGRQTGLIAQEVEKILPSTILTANDARKSKAIKYNELTAILIKAVQEQQKEISDQASQIRFQSAEIRKTQLANKKLEARLDRMERVHLARSN
jgi:hypothetical protein